MLRYYILVKYFFFHFLFFSFSFFFFLIPKTSYNPLHLFCTKHLQNPDSLQQVI